MLVFESIDQKFVSKMIALLSRSGPRENLLYIPVGRCGAQNKVDGHGGIGG